VHHTIEASQKQGLGEQGAVGEVALNELGPGGGGGGLAVAEVIEDGDRMLLGQEKTGNGTADIPCTTGYKNLHHLSLRQTGSKSALQQKYRFRAQKSDIR
jgi:hypothetical protein